MPVNAHREKMMETQFVARSIDIDTILKWELALIFVSAYILLLLYSAVGIRFTRLSTAHPQKVQFVALLLAGFKVLFCFTVYKWVELGVYVSVNLMNTVLSLLWSPLLPLAVVWLYLAHTTKSCSECAISVPSQNVRTLPKYMRAVSFTLSGMVTTALLFASGYICPRNSSSVIFILSITALLGSSVELIYFRARENVINMASPTWMWFCGTWLGAVIISLL